jgi:hypothetical protein
VTYGGWLAQLSPAQRERVLVLVRSLTDEAQVHEARARTIEGNGSSLPVGAGHFDDLLAAVARQALVSALGRGLDLDASVEVAANECVTCVRIHNARRRDVTWQRWTGAGDALCDALGARLRAAASE